MAQSWDYIAKIVSLGDSGAGKSSLTVRLCEGRFSPYHDVTIGVEFGSRIVPVGPPASLSLNINNPAASTPTTPAATPSTETPDDSTPSQPANRKGPKQSAEATAAISNATNVPQKHMKLSLWDTAGQETYKSITRSYFRGASGALLVFDITRRSTFLSATSWLNDLRQIAEDNIVIILVGNKADLAPASTVAPSSTGDDDKDTAAANAAALNQRQVTQAEAQEWCRTNNVMQYVETSAKSGEGVERAFLEVAERIYQNIEAGRYDLNDRRSGVKGAGASGANTARTLNLNMRDGGKSGQKGGGCC